MVLVSLLKSLGCVLEQKKLFAHERLSTRVSIISYICTI